PDHRSLCRGRPGRSRRTDPQAPGSSVPADSEWVDTVLRPGHGAWSDRVPGSHGMAYGPCFNCCAVKALERFIEMRELLPILLIIPLAAAIIVALLGPRRTEPIRWISLAATLASAILALILAGNLAAEPPRTSTAMTFEPSYVTQIDVLPVGPGVIQFYIGLDGINVWLVVLTAVLMVSSVLASWNSPQVKERVNEYFAWLLLLETGMIGLFLAFDIILFYVFFELTLVPLFFLIGIWGGPERRHAARKFFIYTLTGRLITLLGLIAAVVLVYQSNAEELPFSIPKLIRTLNNEHFNSPNQRLYWAGVQTWLFLALIAGFSIKVP